MSMKFSNLPANAQEMGLKVFSNEEFSEYLHNHVSYVKDVLKRKVTSFYPMLIEVFVDSDYKKTQSMVVFGNEDFIKDRYEYMLSLGRVCAKEEKAGNRVFAIFMMFEAWGKTLDEGEELTKDSIAEYDDKEEFIMIVGLTIDGRRNRVSIPITRRKDDTMKTGKEWVQEHDDHMMMETELLDQFFMGYAKQRIKDIRTKGDTNIN